MQREQRSLETARTEQVACLRLLAERFTGASLDERKLRLEFAVGGVRVRVDLSARRAPTVIDNHALDLGLALRVEGPPTQLSLMLRRQDHDAVRDTEAGLMFDVKCGDPAFDAAFIVEAAPSDVVRELLDDGLRALLKAMPADVRVGTLSPGAFLLVCPRQLAAPQIASLVEAGVAIARSARAAFERADQRHASISGPYRGGALPDAVKKQRKQELAAIKQVQNQRFWKEFFR